MPTLAIPPPLRGPTRGAASVTVSGATVGECLEDAGRRHPGFREQVIDARGDVHRFVRLFLNGELLRDRPLATPVGERDEIGIVAAIAGG